jgi:hypothetical protein
MDIVVKEVKVLRGTYNQRVSKYVRKLSTCNNSRE